MLQHDVGSVDKHVTSHVSKERLKVFRIVAEAALQDEVVGWKDRIARGDLDATRDGLLGQLEVAQDERPQVRLHFYFRLFALFTFRTFRTCR